MSGAAHHGPGRRLEVLTTLRFFAALHVTLFHVLGGGRGPSGGFLDNAVRAGPVSVSFFFVLSGFILTQAYASRPPHLAPAAYARSRFARIYPLYFLGLVLMAPTWFAHGGEPGPTLASLALLQSWWPPWANAWNPPAWSLSVEAFFYVLFPLLLPWTQRVSQRVLWLFAGAGWAGMLALAFLYVAVNPDGLTVVDATSQAFWLDGLKFHPVVRLPEFLVGLALGRSAREGAHLPRGVGAVAVLGLGLALAFSDRVPFAVLHNGLYTPLFAAVILAAANAPPGGVRALLEHRVLVALGEASYALYILQTPVLGVVHGVLRRLVPDEALHTALFAPLGLGAALLASVLAWRYVERPTRGRLLPARAA